MEWSRAGVEVGGGGVEVEHGAVVEGRWSGAEVEREWSGGGAVVEWRWSGSGGEVEWSGGMEVEWR